jgi:hypothetical protein
VKRLLDFVSPWALAAIAVWLVVMVIAYNWAIPIYANIGSAPLCGEPLANCSQEGTFTIHQPDTTIFAIVVASMVTAVVAAVVLLARWVSRRPAAQADPPPTGSR